MVVGLLVVAFLALWAGSTLMLSCVPWFQRPLRRGLEDRVRALAPRVEGSVEGVQQWLDAQWAARGRG